MDCSASQLDLIDQVFLQNGFKIFHTEGFGSCFFQAVVGSLTSFGHNYSGTHLMLREQVADFLLVNRHERYHPEVAWTFNSFYEATSVGLGRDSFELYVNSLRNEFVWADELAIQATAAYLRRPILCYVDTCRDWTSFIPPLEDTVRFAEPLVIANIRNCHFVGSMPLLHDDDDSFHKSNCASATHVLYTALSERKIVTSAPNQVEAKGRIVVCPLSESAYIICFLGFSSVQMHEFPFVCRFIRLEDVNNELNAASTLLADRNLLGHNKKLRLPESVTTVKTCGFWVCGTGSRFETYSSLAIFKSRNILVNVQEMEHTPADVLDCMAFRILGQMCMN